MPHTNRLKRAAQHDHQNPNGFTASRPAVMSAVRLLLVGIASLPLMRAAPTKHAAFTAMADDEEPPLSPTTPTLWIYLAVAVALVLLGGAFAGLTIALMGQVRDCRLSSVRFLLTTLRTRSICKLSRHPAKAQSGSMLRMC